MAVAPAERRPPHRHRLAPPRPRRAPRLSPRPRHPVVASARYGHGRDLRAPPIAYAPTARRTTIPRTAPTTTIGRCPTPMQRRRPVVESMEGFHTHDGFYLRVHVGIAATGVLVDAVGDQDQLLGRRLVDRDRDRRRHRPRPGPLRRGVRDQHLEPRQAGRRRQHDRRPRQHRCRRDRPRHRLLLRAHQSVPLCDVRAGGVHRRRQRAASDRLSRARERPSS